MLIPWASLYLVFHLAIASELRLLVMLFTSIYCSYPCSELAVVLFILAEVCLFAKYLPKLLAKWEALNNHF
jgi:uncharacterized membrane protein